jgi:hypothetical protein
LALAAALVLLGTMPLSAQETLSLRIGPAGEKSPAAAPPGRSFVYDPLADLRRNGEGDELKLGGPFYQPDAVKAALSYLPPDMTFGPSDSPDYAEQDRKARLAAYATALARMPRHHTTILGMPCDLASPLGFTCHVPGTDCIVGIGFPPIALCPF